MRVALDTNVLVYAEGINGSVRAQSSKELIRTLPESNTYLPVQVLGELFHVLVRKSDCSPATARATVLRWQNTFPLIETSPSVLLGAMDVAVHHPVGTWDAVILAASAAAGCRLLLSEDMQEGFTWGGVTVVNPFAPKKHELLRALLDPE